MVGARVSGGPGMAKGCGSQISGAAVGIFKNTDMKNSIVVFFFYFTLYYKQEQQNTYT